MMLITRDPDLSQQAADPMPDYMKKVTELNLAQVGYSAKYRSPYTQSKTIRSLTH